MQRIDERLQALRNILSEHQLDAYIVPSSDPHQSEYVAEAWKYREWISGFTGSAGTAVITEQHAGLWTDSRYFIQAEQQLQDSDFVLHKLGTQGASEYTEFLIEELSEGDRIGANPWMMSVQQWERLEKTCEEWELKLVATDDLIALIWIDQPALPKEKVFAYPIEYAGSSSEEKLARIRKEMKSEEVDYYLITTLDDLAWVFNLRGKDVKCNPVAIAYAIISEDHAMLFIDSEKLPSEIMFDLESRDIEIKPYEEIATQLSYLMEDDTIWVHAATVSKALYDVIEDAYIYRGSNMVMRMKAVKNKVEIAGVRKAMRKDGVALTKFFRWLEHELSQRTVSEAEAAQQLAAFRSEQSHYYGESFDAIVGYAGNGAIVHYRAEAGKDAHMKRDGILLLDSGGQYYEGTTDITRTIALGIPSESQIMHYTAVLKGHIALDRAIFPKGTTGIQLDTFARQFLWRKHLNYGHGTGHGVGVFLNVHEPPQGFAPSFSLRGKTALKPGMITSNEPGYYETDSHGIRIENLVLTHQVATGPDGTPYLGFETLTLFPIDTQLIDRLSLTTQELEWLNQYHQKVYEELSPLLEDKEKIWLKEKCALLS